MIYHISSSSRSNPEEWDEQDEIDYIGRGEPLRDRIEKKDKRNKTTLTNYRRQSPVLLFPFLAIMWVYHTLRQLVAGVFKRASNLFLKNSEDGNE
jgi:hypothetical protein